MRVAVAFMLLISLATAFKLEKERPVFEDEPNEQDKQNERDEPEEQDEPEERDEQEEDEDGNKVESLYGRIFDPRQNYCCTHVCHFKPLDYKGGIGGIYQGKRRFRMRLLKQFRDD